MIKFFKNLFSRKKKKGLFPALSVHVKRYVKKSCDSDMTRCEDILNGKLSVERFAKLWEDDKKSVMLMLTAIEYEFLSKEKYTEVEVDVMRHFLGNIALFFKACSEEKAEDLLKQELSKEE